MHSTFRQWFDGATKTLLVGGGERVPAGFVFVYVLRWGEVFSLLAPSRVKAEELFLLKK